MVIPWIIYGLAMLLYWGLLVASGLTSLLKLGFDAVVQDGVLLDTHRCLSVASGLTPLLKVGFYLIVQEGKLLDALSFDAWNDLCNALLGFSL